MSTTPEKKPRTNHLELARRILEHTQETGLVAGAPVAEQALARTFQVSRTLIRGALKVLLEENLLSHEAGKGYRLAALPTGQHFNAALPQAEEEELATSVLRDRMAGRLGDSISISELMRRYDIGRPAAQKALAQLSESQAIERGPGQSWLFRPSLNNLAALEESLKFRLILEPEALLNPNFNADPQRLSLLRSAMQLLLASPVEHFDIQQFRELDISFHELIAQSCGNRFIGDALLQHQSLRRLPNLLPTVSVHRLQEALREHLQIIAHIERGQLEIAADVLRLHLRLSAAQRPQTANRGIPQGQSFGRR
ncbi:GntR family transcriptional regulator [Pseudomonas sp. B21-040]|uniref:GntR family transcriptional regulator n=1 Tax=unclassified Pseudomonas TaxID=196821 RepID=UPI000D6BBAA7|nr:MULTISPECIES: GntR family transcriptional regulator [unclassified Pseudomonas]PWK41312.1 DNA-binding GntR family transcriptional regulator [Pseudomonas sp. OV226]UVL38071.1 GntR family transcriptional regulator [Pseudomonas sp. B21-040]